MAQVTLSVFLDKHYGSMMHAKRCCEQLEQRLYEIRHQSRITSPRYSSSRVVSSWNRGGAEQTATRIIALEEKIAEMRLTNVAERLVMWKAIYAIEDCRLRLIVGLRYLDGLTWEEMSERLEDEERGPYYSDDDPTNATALKKYFHRHRNVLDETMIDSNTADCISVS